MKTMKISKHPAADDAGGRVHGWFEAGRGLLGGFRFRPGLAIPVLLASATLVFAQSNGVPGPEDYAKFSAFITDRNIFNPNRQPHHYAPGYHPPRAPVRTAAPDTRLVGTMSYEKGIFAFFSGNSAEMQKVLQAGQTIADYKVAAVAPGRVRLESADKKDEIELKVGDGLRQEDGKWVFAKAGTLPVAPVAPETVNSAGSPGGNAAPVVPPSASQQNDVLKRLMELREKENQ